MAIQSTQRSIRKEESYPLPYLPPEIIFQILCRLPVESLLRFRCVCKSWRSLISHPEFVKTHLSLQSVNTDYTHHRLVLKSNYAHHDFNSCSIFYIMHQLSDTPARLDYLSFNESPGKDWIEIQGSCNGLVCMSVDRNTLYICNLSTRKSRKLPGIKMPSNMFRSSGFCYDESIGDYKVFVIFGVVVDGCRHNKVEVYTLRTNSWRRIGDCPHPLYGTYPGKLVNGALHWTSIVNSNWTIVSLDLANETFGEVLQPDYRYGSKDFTLGVLSGCLCITCQCGDCTDVWVMKKYGDRESWTKLVVIPSPYNFYPSYLSPLCILKNSQILMDMETHLVRYNPKDATLSFPVHDRSASFSAYPYIKSLVSPDCDADHGVQWHHLY